MPVCSTIGSTIDRRMVQGSAISIIVLGRKNLWYDELLKKTRVDPRNECIEVKYKREWHGEPKEVIIADKHFQITCNRCIVSCRTRRWHIQLGRISCT